MKAKSGRTKPAALNLLRNKALANFFLSGVPSAAVKGSMTLGIKIQLNFVQF
jgi:hypothetical protein